MHALKSCLYFWKIITRRVDAVSDFTMAALVNSVFRFVMVGLYSLSGIVYKHGPSLF